MKTLMYHTTPSHSPHNALHSPSIDSALFVRDAIFPHCTSVHVHSCSRDETRKTEWLNSQGNQRNRDLKNGEEKGGTISKAVTDHLTVCFVTLPPTGSRPSIIMSTERSSTVRTRTRETHVTLSSSPSLLSNMYLEKSFWNSIPQVQYTQCSGNGLRLQQKRPDPTAVCAQQISTIDTWEDSAKMSIFKVRVTWNQWNAFVHTEMLNPHS